MADGKDHINSEDMAKAGDAIYDMAIVHLPGAVDDIKAAMKANPKKTLAVHKQIEHVMNTMGKVYKKEAIMHLKESVEWMNKNLGDNCAAKNPKHFYDVAGAAIDHWKM